MSRYLLSRDFQAGWGPVTEVWVGWDEPLWTLWGQKLRRAGAEEEAVLWVGYPSTDRISDVAELARLMGVEIPGWLAESLRTEVKVSEKARGLL